MDSDFYRVRSEAYGEILSNFDPEQLRQYQVISQLRNGPIPAVLDTSCVRTGLQSQMRRGIVPATVHAAQAGRTPLFMEKDTMEETWEKLPEFADQMAVRPRELKRIFGDWLPDMSIVSLPERHRQLDQRAVAVRELDPDDYPTAALAALLSPCILLTHNHKHFAPLGVTTSSQGVEAVVAVIDLRIGQTHMQSVVLVPAAPAFAVGAATKWAADRIGPTAWLILAVILVGGFFVYRRQPEERRESIKEFGAFMGNALLEESAKAMTSVQDAEERLSGCLIPGPEERSATSAVLRQLALSNESMSAQRLYETLDRSAGMNVASIRALLHDNKPSVFFEVRRGSFTLGAPYRLRLSSSEG